MSSLCEVLFLFWSIVMYLLSRWDDMDGGIELLAYDVWAAEDDKTGFLSVGVDILINYISNGANEYYKTKIREMSII